MESYSYFFCVKIKKISPTPCKNTVLLLYMWETKTKKWNFLHLPTVFYPLSVSLYEGVKKKVWCGGKEISEFCGLTIKDIDLGNRIVNIDHQLQRLSDMTLVIEPTKTSAGTRKLPVTEDVAKCFQAIIEDREKPKVEKVMDIPGSCFWMTKDCR